MAEGFASALLTNHCRQEMERRGILENQLRRVLESPEQSSSVRAGRVVLQSVLEDGYLLRVFVDVGRSPPEVVTAYRTSKIEKYSRPS